MAKKKKCPNCRGTGQVMENIALPEKGMPDYQPVYFPKVCPVCNGKRKIKKEKPSGTLRSMKSPK
jgi:DnaJ-class molecular chaperone